MQEVTRNDKMDCLISEIEKTVTVAKEHLTGAVNQTITKHIGEQEDILLNLSDLEMKRKFMEKICCQHFRKN